MNEAPPPLGRIITFYSYKGGTGRSMALANVAWILASMGRRVLAIDWDLEAPGLHRYFRPFLIDEELTATEGLMDFVDRYANEAIRPLAEGERADPDWFLPFTDFSDYVVSINFPSFRSGGKIDLLPAGKVLRRGSKVPFPEPQTVATVPQFVSLPELVSLKLDSWSTSPLSRLKDKADVVELIKHRNLPRDLAVAPAVRQLYEELWDGLKTEA